MEMTAHNSAEEPRVAVIGVGNILMSDEGFGVHLVQELERSWTFSPAVQLTDGGTMGMELLGFMDSFDHLLLLDAIEGKSEPGSIYSFNHEDAHKYFSSQVSAHEVGIQDVLFIQSLGEHPLKACHVIGLEPVSLEPCLELTPLAQTRLSQAAELCIEVLESWGVNCTRKRGE